MLIWLALYSPLPPSLPLLTVHHHNAAHHHVVTRHHGIKWDGMVKFEFEWMGRVTTSQLHPFVQATHYFDTAPTRFISVVRSVWIGSDCVALHCIVIQSICAHCHWISWWDQQCDFSISYTYTFLCPRYLRGKQADRKSVGQTGRQRNSATF